MIQLSIKAHCRMVFFVSGIQFKKKKEPRVKRNLPHFLFHQSHYRDFKKFKTELQSLYRNLNESNREQAREIARELNLL